MFLSAERQALGPLCQLGGSARRVFLHTRLRHRSRNNTGFQIGGTNANIYKRFSLLQVSPEVTEFTQLAQRLVAMSTVARKTVTYAEPTAGTLHRSNFILPVVNNVIQEPANTQSQNFTAEVCMLALFLPPTSGG
jgi:hypothetical protein